MTSDFNSFRENVENVVNAKVWVKIVYCLKQLKDWLFSVITKETEVNAKKNTPKCLILSKIKYSC